MSNSFGELMETESIKLDKAYKKLKEVTHLNDYKRRNPDEYELLNRVDPSFLKKHFARHNPESYFTSEHKADKRKKLLSLLENDGKSKKIFTLAGEYGLDVREACGKFSKTMVWSCEQDLIKYKKQEKHLENEPVALLHGSLSSNLPILKNYTFDLAHLDFCGPLTKNKENEYKYFLENKMIKDQGYIAITLQLAREYEKDHLVGSRLLDLVQGDWDMYLENRPSYLKKTFRSIAYELGIKVEYVEHVSGKYRNSDVPYTDALGHKVNPPPMGIFVFKVMYP